MNIPDHISESLKLNFWVKNTLILWSGSGSGIRNLRDPRSKIWDGKIWIRDTHPGSATLQYLWFIDSFLLLVNSRNYKLLKPQCRDRYPYLHYEVIRFLYKLATV
jgi:hypothetical protein